MGARSWAELGFGSAESALGALIQAPFDIFARKQNFKYGEQSADNADRRWRQQYQDFFTPSAMLRQYEDAGLSPSMIFSGSGAKGAGGATAPQGTGAMGIGGHFSPIDAPSLAQIRNLEEQTRGLKIENDNKQKNIDADIALKLSQAGLNKAAEAYNKIQTDREELKLFVDEQTTDDEIKKRNATAESIYWESWKMYYESQSSNAKSQVDLQTIQTRVNQELADYRETLLNIKVGESVVRLNDATIDKLANEVAIAWYNADTSRMSYQSQRRFYEETIMNQIDKMAQDKTLTEEQINAMKQGQWLNFATDIFGSICNTASTIAPVLLKK